VSPRKPHFKALLRILHAYLECTGKWKGNNRKERDMAKEAEFTAEEALELAIAGKWEEAARKLEYNAYYEDSLSYWGPFIHAVLQSEKMMRRRRNAGQS
jgi:hypothetical protein